LSLIYLDHNASAPVIPAARDAMRRALEAAGTPSSHHAAGRAARAIVEEARERVAAAIGARPAEIVFTSGGTEAVALAVLGGARAAAAAGRPRRVVVSPTEHACVLAAAETLRAEGFAVASAAVDAAGRTSADALTAALGAEGAALVAVASASNEIGTRNDILTLARLARARGALFACDAVQSLGKEPIDAGALGADFLALSAHKIGGPKGAGALYVREGSPLAPLLRGGPQEAERRAGTENVPGIAGFGAAALALPERLAAVPRLRALRDRLRAAILAAIPAGAAVESGDPAGGLANTLHLCFPGLDGDALRIALDLAGVAVSGGSACASGAHGPSHVLLAIGHSPALARTAVRISLGPENTAAEVEAAAGAIAAAVCRLRRA
jgi:cysteine desulfurase